MNNLQKAMTVLGLFLTAHFILIAQDTNNDGKSWKERIMSEKIAFLTTEAKITPEEAQKFWPVYNQIWEERWEARHDAMKHFQNLDNAIKENRPAKEISSLLDIYLSSIDRMTELDSKAADRFKEVLPAEKVARIYVSEEKFRRQQIHKLHHNEKKN